MRRLEEPPAWDNYTERRSATKHPTLPIRAKVQGSQVKLLSNTGEESAVEPAATLKGHSNKILSLRWHPDPQKSSIIATGSNDKTAKVWDISTGECITTLVGHAAGVLGMHWHPSKAAVLATGSWDDTTRIWNTANGECTCILAGHANAPLLAMGGGSLGGWHPTLPMIVSAEWHPVLPNIYATGSGDTTSKIWNVSTGDCIATLRGHTGWVRSVCWHPDDPSIIATSSFGQRGDKTARLWEIPELFNPFWKFAHRLIIPSLARAFIHFVMLVGEAMNREAVEGGGELEDEVEVASGHGPGHAKPLPPHLWLEILTFAKVRELRFRDNLQ